MRAREAITRALSTVDPLSVFGFDFVLLIIAGAKYEGTTDGEGYINETIPADAAVGQLTLWIDRYPTGTHLNWAVELKDDPFTPASDIDGALRRLRNLGYYLGEAGPRPTPEAVVAVRKFQADHGLEQTGELDGPTTSKLEEKHGV